MPDWTYRWKSEVRREAMTVKTGLISKANYPDCS